ncbi:MAG TPA: hypothetical protein VNX01_10795, partial [Bacteroidia bacterium]|nr:hypothetical protein [Bacteroidia bacterium]
IRLTSNPKLSNSEKITDPEILKNIAIYHTFDFQFSNYLKLEKDLPKNDKKYLLKRVAESIIKWMEELKSSEGKLNPKYIDAYKQFTLELWRFHQRVIEMQNNLKQKQTGRPISKYKEFKDCLTLNELEYENLEKTLENYLFNGCWKPKLKSDYSSLVEALIQLKYTKKFEKEPFARAFCNSFKSDYSSLGHRRKTKSEDVNEFKILLKNVRG